MNSDEVISKFQCVQIEEEGEIDGLRTKMLIVMQNEVKGKRM